MKINFENAREISFAISDVIGYLTDNSCSDETCCGGPLYDKREYEDALETLKKFGLDFEQY